VCTQKAKFADSIKIGCIGDSITAGVSLARTSCAAVVVAA
jgi:hypothetical protein